MLTYTIQQYTRLILSENSIESNSKGGTSSILLRHIKKQNRIWIENKWNRFEADSFSTKSNGFLSSISI